LIYLQLSGITKTYDANHLLKGIDLTVQRGDRIGLVGPNGAGKTTVLKIAKGDIPPQSGDISTARGIKVGYVSQEDEISSEYTLFLAMIESFTELLEIRSEMDKLEPRLAAGDRNDLAQYGELQLRWEALGGYNLDTDIKATLLGLGFNEDDLYRSVNSFSGGERNRAALARELLHAPDLLLLDEPTNHLDIESTVWLEQYLSSFDGAVVAVSHDRVFLDHIVTRIVELDHGYLETYHGNFSNFWTEREERRRLQLKKYLEQKEEIERIEDFIRRNIAGQKTRQAQSRRHNLSKLERLEAPTSDARKPKLSLEVSRRSFKSIVKVDDLAFGYGSRTLFSNVNFEIERGEKVGLIGKNGSGKSTLVKLLVEELEAEEGSIEIGRNVDFKYFDQELSDLDDEKTVIDTIWDIRPELEAYGLRSYLARFLFLGDDVFKEVKMLSGGEKKKLALARLLALPANFLILDEPTNHLDIGSLEALQDALLEYDGTILFISHDRHFLDRVAGRILAIRDGRVLDSPGNYSEFVRRFDVREEAPVDIEERIEKRVSYRQEKREKNIRSARRKRIKELESLICDQEGTIDHIERQLISEDNASDWEKLDQLEADKKAAEDHLDELVTEFYQLIEEEDETADS
jgi:ATP-binding cassette subfamily F protein 3